MRAVLVVSLLLLLCPAIAMAQSPAAPATPAEPVAPSPSGKGHAKGADITRDEYIERAVERAKRAAATRFDKLDANHNGVLTAEERRAARAAKKAGAAPQ